MKLPINMISLKLVSLAALATSLLASSGVITTISTNKVSGTGPDMQTGDRINASSAAGTTWVTAWQTVAGSGPAALQSYVSAWNGAWNNPTQLLSPGGVQQNDVNLAWDQTRSRFVFASLDGVSGNVWYGYSTNSTFTSWTFATEPFTTATGMYTYPSIGVDASGRVIIGAVKDGPSGFYTVVSTNGSTFTAPSKVGSSTGQWSRVVATSNTFQAFVETFNALSTPTPTAVSRYQSSDGVNWSSPTTLATFTAPFSNHTSSNGTSIGYSPWVAASGYTNGLWAVAFSINNGGFNNIELCTSDRGCGIANSEADDEFLAGVSVSGDSGYWVAYYAYSTLNTRALPLIRQTVYFPHTGTYIGATVNSNIDPTAWYSQSSPQRCSQACYFAGDYSTISSNPYQSANLPFVERDSSTTDVYQSFVEDPLVVPNILNFAPNYIPVPTGADLTGFKGWQ